MVAKDGILSVRWLSKKAINWAVFSLLVNRYGFLVLNRIYCGRHKFNNKATRDDKWYTLRSPQGDESSLLCKSEIIPHFLGRGRGKVVLWNLKSNLTWKFCRGRGQVALLPDSSKVALFGTHFSYTVSTGCFTVVSSLRLTNCSGNLLDADFNWTFSTQESPPAWRQEAYRPQEGARSWPPPPPGWIDLWPWHPLPGTWIDLWPWHPPSWIDLWPWPPSSWTWPPPPAPRWIDLWPWPPRLDWPLILTPPSWTWPRPPRCGQSENITFPILRMRAVKSRSSSRTTG